MKNKFILGSICIFVGICVFPFFANALTSGPTINVDGSNLLTNPVFVPNTVVSGNAMSGYTVTPVSPHSTAYITQHRYAGHNIPGFWRGNTNPGTFVATSCDGAPAMDLANIYSGGNLQYNHFALTADAYIQSTCQTNITTSVVTSPTNPGGPVPWQYWPSGYYYQPERANQADTIYFGTDLYFQAYAVQSEVISDGVFVDFVPPVVTDLCANILGNQSSVPADMYADGGNCYYYPPAITFTGPPPVTLPLCGSANISWTSQYAQYGCSPSLSGPSLVTVPSTEGSTNSITVTCSGYGGGISRTHTITARAALGNNCAVSQCSDSLDNDSDGYIDYPNDPECDNSNDDDESPVAQCSDGLDNDGDSLVDYPLDPGCSSGSDNDETNSIVPTQCSDGIDNADPEDVLVDYPADPGCLNASDNDETNTIVLTQCSDSIDNDGDGLVDYPADPGCANSNDNDEFNVVVLSQCSDGIDNADPEDVLVDYPADPGCLNASDNDETNIIGLSQCSDAIDNDGDGFTDYPNDGGCLNALDNDEVDPIIALSPVLYFTATDYTPAFFTGTTINWTAYNVTSCNASGDWSGSKALSGSESTGISFRPKTYVLTCTGAYGSIEKTIRISFGSQYACLDGADNDNDGFTDYSADPGCTDITDDDEANSILDVCPNLVGVQSSLPPGYAFDGNGNCFVVVTQCSDSIDNDSDGFIDYPSDLDCLSASDISENGPLGGGTQCSDSIDNDSDGFVDTNDAGCHTDGNPGNSGSYNPSDTNETNNAVVGFTIGSPETIKIVFATPGMAESESKTIAINSVGGFTGNVTINIGSISPALPVGTTALYSFNGGAFSASPSVTIPYNGSASLKVRISNKITSPYMVTLTGTSSGFSDSTKQYTIVPTTVITTFEEY